jgi:hypothetical protein
MTTKFVPTDGNVHVDVYAKEFRRIILVDFDGVLHLFKRWGGAALIDGPAVPGAIDWLTMLVQHRTATGAPTFDVQIYSSRCKYPPGVDAMKAWLLENGITAEVLAEITFTETKSAAWLLVDDRCFRFEGTFPTPEWILHFESWTKQMPVGPDDAAFLRELANGGEGTWMDGAREHEFMTEEDRRRLRGIADWIEGIYRSPR